MRSQTTLLPRSGTNIFGNRLPVLGMFSNTIKQSIQLIIFPISFTMDFLIIILDESSFFVQTLDRLSRLFLSFDVSLSSQPELGTLLLFFTIFDTFDIFTMTRQAKINLIHGLLDPFGHLFHST